MLLNSREETMAFSHFTEPELRQLHRRFGHPSVQRFVRVLERSGHDVDNKMLENITKFCHYCQLHSKAPGRFRFTLKDDYNFNYSVLADVVHLEGRQAVHIVDDATGFQAAMFVKDMKAKTVWDAIHKCWINTYLGPPDLLTTDEGREFYSTEFKQYAKQLGVNAQTVPVEAHNSVGKIERYHTPLRRAYKIIRAELKDENIDDEACLQMAIKAINDTAGPDGLVPTLLVFGAYPRMTASDAPSPSVVKRASAIDKAMDQLRSLSAKRKIADARNMRNGPNITAIMDLPLLSEVIA